MENNSNPFLTDNQIQPPNPFTVAPPQPDLSQPPNPFTVATPQPNSTQPPNPFTVAPPQPDLSQPPNPFTVAQPQPNSTQPPNPFTTTPQSDTNTNPFTVTPPQPDLTQSPNPFTIAPPQSDFTQPPNPFTVPTESFTAEQPNSLFDTIQFDNAEDVNASSYSDKKYNVIKLNINLAVKELPLYITADHEVAKAFHKEYNIDEDIKCQRPSKDDTGNTQEYWILPWGTKIINYPLFGKIIGRLQAVTVDISPKEMIEDIEKDDYEQTQLLQHLILEPRG